MQESKDSSEAMQPNWIIIDGIPDLIENQDYARYATALEEAAKTIANNGSKIEPIVYIPFDKKVSKHSEDLIIDGSGFIEFGNVEDAQEFSKNYRNLTPLQPFLGDLVCYSSREVDELEALPDEYHKLTRDEFQTQRNLLWWLLDEEGGERYADQYVIRYQGTEFQETNVFWMDENQVKERRTLCYDASELKQQRQEMTRQFVQWSPNGYYLLTTHPQGIQLWGGPNWQSFQKLSHNRVDKMSFSPNETFLITCNTAPYENSSGNRQNPECKIWDVLTGQEIITVKYSTIGPGIKLRLPGWWPIFKWSFNEEYIAKINSERGMNAKAKDLNKINIFKLCDRTEDSGYDCRYTVEKLGGKSITVDALFNMEFSPSDNILAYTTFAQNDDQSKVSLISIPSKNSLRVQTLGFDVVKAHLYWQSLGRYLAINMAHSASKSNFRLIRHHSIGIMTVRDKNMPFSRTDKLGIIMYFAWQPNGDRFGVIHRDGAQGKRIEPDVSIYIVSANNKPRLILKIDKKRVNELYWSPATRDARLVIANVDKTRRAGGELEFIDVSNYKTRGATNSVSVIHENMTDIEWCPSGRYLVTATTQFLESTSGDDTRYIIWSYQGEKLKQYKIKYFYQILWRPVPKNLLRIHSKSDVQRINSKLSSGWDELFQQFDNDKRMEATGIGLVKNKKKKEKYAQDLKSIKKKSRYILEQREKLRALASPSSYTTRNIQQKLEKSVQQFVIAKDIMRKILSEEISDFDKWRNQ